MGELLTRAGSVAWGHIMANSFHSVVAQRAWDKTVAEVLGQSINDRLIRFLAFAATLALSWMYFGWMEQASQELSALKTAGLISVGAVVTVFICVLIINLLYVVPAAIFREQQTEISEHREWRKPRLSAEAWNEGRPYPLGVYQAVGTAGGDYQVNISGENRNICLLIKNGSALKAETVQARLVDLEGDNGFSLRDSVKLWWAHAAEGEYWGDIGAGGKGTLLLFKETAKGLQLAGPGVAPEYLNVLLDGKIFSGRLTVTEEHQGALEVKFVLNTEEKKITLLGTGAING